MPSKLLEGGSRSVLVFALCSISFMSECDLCHDPDDPRSLDVVSLPTSLTFSEVELDPPPPLEKETFYNSTSCALLFAFFYLALFVSCSGAAVTDDLVLSQCEFSSILLRCQYTPVNTFRPTSPRTKNGRMKLLLNA